MAKDPYWEGFWRQLWKSILVSYVGLVVVLVALAGALGLGYLVSELGVLPVATGCLSLASLLSLLGSLWIRPLVYAGTPLAWLAMTALFIERSLAQGLHVWGATAWWVLANLAAAAIYTGTEVSAGPAATRHRSLLFYGLFVAWPATALLFVGTGNALGVSSWISIGSWIAWSFAALVVYLWLSGDDDQASASRPQDGLAPPAPSHGGG
jgi:hypothetical protein